MKLLFLFLVVPLMACATAPQVSSAEVTPAQVSLPNHLSQSKKIKALKSYFTYWREKYLKASNGTTPGGGYYIKMKGVGPGGEASITTSEAHGYGMLAFVLMADEISDAKAIFDGLFNMYYQHRSSNNSYTMSWIIKEDERGHFGSATDGDLDIAYALLLAHKKWGSQGTINYLTHAKNLIQKGIKVADFSSSGRTNLGDWDRDRYNTRSSDWMPSHFQAYYQVTQDRFWLNAVNTIYDLIHKLQTHHSPATGLLPDFVIGQNPQPAPPNFLDEGTVDFSWNACRTPLRIALDYKLYGRPEAKQSLMKSLKWLVDKTGGDPKKIKAGYFLDGRPQESYTSAAFTAPWVVAATVDPRYQRFVNKGWDQIVKSKSGYYEDSITLLSLIYLTDKWQAP